MCATHRDHSRYYKLKLGKFYGIGLCFLGITVGADTRPLVPTYNIDEAVNSITTDSGVPTKTESTSGVANAQLFDLLEQLQDEVRRLTGEVELLGYDLSRLKQDEKDRYIDLDRRIIVLNQRKNEAPKYNNVAPIANTTTIAPTKPASSKKTIESNLLSPPTPVKENPETEKMAYKAAFELIKSRQYEQAKLALRNLINEFPTGAYAANSYYWLGEVLLVQSEYIKAAESFDKVISGFVKHRKVPDALYKIGVAYNKMEQKEKAKAYLQRVIADYPESSSARLALNLLD
jgi:tol-pal system protein YbgF